MALHAATAAHTHKSMLCNNGAALGASVEKTTVMHRECLQQQKLADDDDDDDKGNRNIHVNVLP